MHSSSSRACFSGVPTFFRACCRTAAGGGDDIGYEHPGRELMRHVRRLDPLSLELHEWSAICDELDEVVHEGDSREILSWFVRHFPHCMALVPRRRRAAFVRGVRAMSVELRILDSAESES